MEQTIHTQYPDTWRDSTSYASRLFAENVGEGCALAALVLVGINAMVFFGIWLLRQLPHGEHAGFHSAGLWFALFYAILAVLCLVSVALFRRVKDRRWISSLAIAVVMAILASAFSLL